MLRQLMRDFHKRVPVSRCVELFGYLNERVLTTYAGDCLAILGLTGADCECLEQSEIDDLANQQQRARRLLGQDFHFYEYLFRRQTGKLYSTELFAAILKLGPKQKTSILSPKKSSALLGHGLDRRAAEVARAAEGFASLAGDRIAYRLLTRNESFQMLRRLLNFTPELLGRQRPVCDEFIGFQLADGDIDSLPADGHLKVEKWFLRVLTLTELAAESRPLMFEPIQRIQGNFFVCTEWHAREDGKETVNKTRDVTNNFKGAGAVSLSTKKTPLADEGDVLDVGELGDIQRRMRRGELVGNFSLTAVAFDEDLAEMDRTAHEIERALAMIDCKLRPERLNQLGAYLAAIPGNYGYQLRRIKIMDSNAADLGLWFAPALGDSRNIDLDAPSLMRVETDQFTGYDLNLHWGGKGHTAIVGGSRSGKSFLLNVIIRNLRQKYDAFVLIFDKGRSFRWTVEKLGGSYFELSLASKSFEKFTLNPFAVQETQANVDFLTSFVRFLMERDDLPLTSEELAKVHERVNNLFKLEVSDRRLGLLEVLLGNLGKRLRRWCQGGQYGWVFDNERDTLSLSDFQCFEFQGMEKYPDVREALFMLIFHRADQLIFDAAQIGRVKVFAIDEAWSILGTETGRARVEESVRTGGKNNNMVIVSTQSVAELSEKDILLECCQTRLFLSNPEFNREKYGKVFNLTPAKLEKIAGLIPQQQFMLDRPDIAKVLNLRADEETKWLASNDPKSNAIRERFRVEHGERWLEELVNANGGAR
jgi:type IV secretory pathway VirB4 component